MGEYLNIYWNRNTGERVRAGEMESVWTCWVWYVLGILTGRCLLLVSSWRWRSGSKKHPWFCSWSPVVISVGDGVYTMGVGSFLQRRTCGMARENNRLSRSLRNTALIPIVDFRISIASEWYPANKPVWHIFYPTFCILVFIHRLLHLACSLRS